ncbi:TetR/AcrR family transcriptional regulator [Allopusillimonas ginsengisoli]|uniref:TetR/AcrR family transcriptional regulator n=1 Tax=Allopusillimonas ginsengisoli TaxID=453575 RepID=UPI00101E9C1B|nr:TetR/AcrR family transcriptional regulator [Allopusillimonas ginsengisoli]TEA78608.1 TetR/AcrR family transcriptional regulator [Allopusillimonas ginsengisoli]
MIADFESFKIELSLSQVEICRELYRQNTDLIRIKKEHVAVRSLVRIIDSTLRLTSVKGFHAMSLRDLSADSGMSIGGLYAYIRNKEDLIYLIQSHGFLLTRRTMLAYTRDIAHPRDKLLAGVKAHVYLSELMQPWFYFSFMETKSLPDQHKKEAIAIELEVENILCAIIEEGIAHGAFRQVDARLLASLCKAMMQDWYLKRGKYNRQQVDATRYAVFIGSVLERYLLP